jgi:ABC-2 type transport system permease protein
MISAEIYKLRKSESFWLMLLIIGVLSALFSVVLGVLPAEDLMGMRPETAGEMLMSGFGSIMQNILFLLIGFTVVFINSDFSLLTVRNPLAVGVSRLNYLCAKFVTILIICFLFMTIATIATGLPSLLFAPWGDAFILSNFISTFIIGYLILVAQGTLFMTVALMTRKVGSTLGIIIAYILLDALVAGSLMFAQIDGIFRTLLNIFPSAAGFYLQELALGTAEFGNVLLIVAVSIVMILATGTLAVRNIARKDV